MLFVFLFFIRSLLRLLRRIKIFFFSLSFIVVSCRMGICCSLCFWLRRCICILGIFCLFSLFLCIVVVFLVGCSVCLFFFLLCCVLACFVFLLRILRRLLAYIRGLWWMCLLARSCRIFYILLACFLACGSTFCSCSFFWAIYSLQLVFLVVRFFFVVFMVVLT